MTTVEQLIEYLQTIPKDVEVYVLKESIHAHSLYTEFVPMDLYKHTSRSEKQNRLYLGD